MTVRLSLREELRVTARRVMLPLYGRLTTVLPPPVPEGQAIACHSGCGACCWQAFPVELIDAVVIVDHLRAEPPKLQAVLARAAAREEELRGLYGTPRYFANETPAPCVLFQRERSLAEGEPENYRGGCSVYVARPVVCRTFYVTSPPERCRPGQERERVVYDMRSVSEEVRERLRATLDPWLLMPLPLPVGLRWGAILLAGGTLDAADVAYWQSRVERAERVRDKVFAGSWQGPAQLGVRR